MNEGLVHVSQVLPRVLRGIGERSGDLLPPGPGVDLIGVETVEAAGLAGGDLSRLRPLADGGDSDAEIGRHLFLGPEGFDFVADFVGHG